MKFRRARNALLFLNSILMNISLQIRKRDIKILCRQKMHD